MMADYFLTVMQNLTHKKALRGRGKPVFMCPREAAKLTFNVHDLMQLPVEKFARAVDKITTGERLFTV
jgi:hypothetical protein